MEHNQTKSTSLPSKSNFSSLRAFFLSLFSTRSIASFRLRASLFSSEQQFPMAGAPSGLHTETIAPTIKVKY